MVYAPFITLSYSSKADYWGFEIGLGFDRSSRCSIASSSGGGVASLAAPEVERRMPYLFAASS
jgi:hypothetical protein